jgi:hypothetical protein
VPLELPDPAVPEVQVINPAGRPVLLMAGTVLRGGMQTRMVAGSALLPTNPPVALPVSCVEQGRWGGGAGFELTDSVVPRRVRRTTDVTMTRNLLAGRRVADQSAVWASVEHELRENRAVNPTRNLDTRPEDRRAEAVESMMDLGPLPGQTGVLVSHGERMLGADLFGNSELLAEMWAGLVRSYYANAPERIYGRPSTSFALTFPRYFLTRPAGRHLSVALGHEFRIHSSRWPGRSLRVKTSLSTGRVTPHDGPGLSALDLPEGCRKHFRPE